MTEEQPPTAFVVSDVFTCDPFRVDLDLFRAWTQGATAQDAELRIRERDRQRDRLSAEQRADAEFFSSRRFESLAIASVRHQYHFFRLLAERLERPAVLLDRLELHIPLELHADVVGCYYAFDSAVARLLVGRKLTANLRKDVDDVASDSHVPLTSCLRQYDNFRRVTKAVETAPPQSPTLAFLQHRFCFSDTLAQFVSSPIVVSLDVVLFHGHPKKHVNRRYKSFVFMAFYKPKFNDRRLQGLSYAVVEELANALLCEWTDGSTLDLTIPFPVLRELKTRLKKDAEGWYRGGVLEQLRQGSAAPAFVSSVETHFTGTLRALLRIAADVADARVFDEMFEHLLSNVVDELREQKADRAAVDALFAAMAACEPPDARVGGKHSPDAWRHWQTFLRGMRASALILFDTVPPS